VQVRTAYVTHAREGARTEVTGGLRDLKVLKTTQSGYSGFKKDRFTTLPDVEDRIVASSVTATWK
jgi:urate oxidase